MIEVSTERDKETMTRSQTHTCPEQGYGMLHGGDCKLGQAELLQLQLQHVLCPQVRQLQLGSVRRRVGGLPQGLGPSSSSTGAAAVEGHKRGIKGKKHETSGCDRNKGGCGGKTSPDKSNKPAGGGIAVLAVPAGPLACAAHDGGPG